MKTNNTSTVGGESTSFFLQNSNQFLGAQFLGLESRDVAMIICQHVPEPSFCF